MRVLILSGTVPHAKRNDQRRRTSTKRPREFPDAGGGLVDNERRCGREIHCGDYAGEPQWRSIADGRKTGGGARDYAAADRRRSSEDRASTGGRGNRPRAGRLFVCDSALGTASGFLGHRLSLPHKADEALARLLMECGFCQRREVVYLNELELKSFEVRKCVARLCKHCDTPSIWIEAQSEIKEQEKGGANPLTVEERVIPRRNRTRVKARVLACIRRRGFQEEVAVCEDLSKGGLSFRSRNKYEEGSRVEVAVPFTPGSGAIFVPIRIVFSQAIPSAGLYRHGAAYIRAPMDSAD